MITLKTPQEIQYLRKSGKVVAELLEELKKIAVVGKSTEELDKFAENLLKKKGAWPAFKGYQGYPCTICTSVNEVLIHGIPSAEKKLKAGDILSIDAGASVNGYYGDGAVTVPIGAVKPVAAKLMKVTEEALYKGIEETRPGNYLSDISHAIQTHVEKNGFSVVRDYVGHGIGQKLHEDPQIPNFGLPGQGPRLKVGMVLAIETMVNEGTWEVSVGKDHWTVSTRDGKLAAHFEHTVLVGENGPDILTRC